MSAAALRRTGLLLLKAAVSGLLISFVLRKAGFRNILLHLQGMDLRFFVLSSFVYLFLLLLAAVRWRTLLGGSHPLGRIYSLTLIGAFFNHLLPGAIGGDAVKAYYLYKEAGHGGRVVASVFMDRYVGYAALLCIGLASGLAAFGELRSVGMQWLTPLLFLAFLGGSLLVFGLRIGRRYGSIADFYEYFHETRKDRRVLRRTFLLSLVVQALSILMVSLIARGVGESPSFAALFVFVPIIITATMVPVSISGLGIREGAFVLLFGLAGIPAEASAAIGFLWYLSVATGSLPGLIVYLSRRSSLPRPAAS